MSKRPKRKTLNKKSLSMIGIPHEFIHSSFQDFNTYDCNDLNTLKEYVVNYSKTIDDRFTNNEGILFSGSNGQGKTMLSSLILKEAYRHRYSCRRCTLVQYHNRYTYLWGVNNEEKALEQESFERCFMKPEFLVIDEVGKEIDTRISIPVFEDLLRVRADNFIPTIVCTNLNFKQLKTKYGDSIYSMLVGNMTPIVMTGSDQRKSSFNDRCSK